MKIKNSSMLLKVAKTQRDQIDADAKACGMDRTAFILNMHTHMRLDMLNKFRLSDDIAMEDFRAMLFTTAKAADIKSLDKLSNELIDHGWEKSGTINGTRHYYYQDFKKKGGK
jgi:uncharacterized protein (DUF1778 family)